MARPRMSLLPSNLTPVRDAHAFDQARLADFMTSSVDGFRGPLKVLQFEGGQSNPTFHMTDGGGRMYVLRKKPPGKLLPSAHQVDREYRVIKALSDHTDVPVPKPYALCQDDSVIGTAFYLMEFLPGRILADPKMPGISPSDRGKIFDSMNDVLARIHNVDYRKVGLGDFGREGQYIQRQLARWTNQYDLSRTDNLESMELLKQYLPAHIPPGDETCINHGDYRLGNTIVHPTEPRVIAVLEQLCTIYGGPRQLRCDNGPEFLADAMKEWARQHGVHIHFIEPGKPNQNAYIESFNGSRAPRFLWTAFCEKENELCPRENSTRLRPRREPGGRPERLQPRRRSSARGGGPRDGKSRWSSNSSRGSRSKVSAVATA